MKKEQKIFENSDMAEKFASYPPKTRTKLLSLRELIFEVASKTEKTRPVASGRLSGIEPMESVTKPTNRALLRWNFKLRRCPAADSLDRRTGVG